MKWITKLFHRKVSGKITAIVFYDKDTCSWFAQCLEYDIATQAGTLHDLNYELERAIMGHIVVSREHGLEPFDCLPPAPAKYWKLFEQADIQLRAKPSPYRLPRYFTPPIPEMWIGDLQTA
jgi:hypothetical protein